VILLQVAAALRRTRSHRLVLDATPVELRT
jgi:hypothetical protein